MPKIQGITSLKSKLRQMAQGPRLQSTAVVTGFTQNYALYVHEDMEAHHNVGQAKFLEQPSMTLVPEFRRIIEGAMDSGASLEQALLLAALRLQREAQLLVPVDTAALKNSAFTVVDK